MNIMEMEIATRFAWPALEEKELPFGVLRYSRGTERRSNSLSLYPNVALETASVVDAAESFFTARGMAPVIRLVRSEGIALDAIDDLDRSLHSRGYEKQSPTLSMLLDLKGSRESKENSSAVSIKDLNAELWLEAWYALTDRQMENLPLHKALLGKSDLAHRFLLKQEAGGVPASCGMAVYANQAMGLFGISTAIQHRKRGYAREIVNELVQWGVGQGAKFAYLQVEESNTPARNLYQQLGFKRAYTYWYRVGKQQECSGGMKDE